MTATRPTDLRLGMRANLAQFSLLVAVNAFGVTPATPSVPCITADVFGVRAAIWLIAVITAASGIVVAVRMYETRRHRVHRLGV